MNAKQAESEIRRKLTEANAEEKKTHAIHVLIAATLKAKFAGKKVTKRLATMLEPEIQKIAPGARVVWSTDYSLTQILVWGGEGPKYENRWGFYLRGTEAFDPATFEDSDVCHGKAAADRIAARERLLSDGKVIASLAGSIQTIHAHKANIETLTEFGSDGCEATYIVHDLLK